MLIPVCTAPNTSPISSWRPLGARYPCPTVMKRATDVRWWSGVSRLLMYLLRIFDILVNLTTPLHRLRGATRRGNVTMTVG
jgi:hypothetical protein